MSSAGRDGTHSSRPFCFARVSPFERPDDVPPRIRRTGRIGHKTSGTNRLAGTNEVRKTLYGLYGFSVARRFRRDARRIAGWC
ncbi:protein of unknown function [uncultured Sphingopyxis sp.]|uniref:Transposase n=1 Tax=uncultured Sphingopyxis sp. TaxID=310581 RepID=A0A1Y5PR17_9SPHN|nr:protein of unknown function [uncultured Sphingopyxis sp.]